MARSRARGEDGAGIDLTPLLDIVFIMLIFFIVTSSFVKEPGVQVTRPEALTTKERRLAAILIAVTADNEIWINKKKITLDEVRNAVEQLRRENPKGTAVVQADAECESRYLVEVLNQVKAAGVTEVAVSTEEV
jgi:biopolymer transport protein ExbD